MRPKIWHKSYGPGVPPQIEQNYYSSLNDVFTQIFDKFGPRPAMHNMGKTLSYDDLKFLSRKFASYLQNDLQLKKGDRVALMLPNLLQYPVALFGILQAGMVAVNVNPLYTERELEHQLKDSGAKAIVIYTGAARTLEKIIDNTEVQHVIVTGVGDFLDFPKNILVNLAVKYVKKLVPSWKLPGCVSINRALTMGDAHTFAAPVLSLEDLAFLQYTGGTTGVSKGAMLTHGNICANILQVKAWIGNALDEGGEIVITPLPLYHIFSLTANCLCLSSLGALNVLITNPRDLDGLMVELSKWRFTCMTGVNTLFNAMLAHPEFSKLDFSRFKFTLGGGMAVIKATAEAWKEVTGKPLIEAYGLTETSPAACMNRVDLAAFNGSVGLPIPSTDVCILDDQEKEVVLGHVGEICIKGPQVMPGYWNRPDETANVMTASGFFKTGDLGTMDEDGFVRIVDRKKDMILVSGFNVYPNEIEDVVCAHPKIFEAAAIGVPDDKSGEAIKLFVVKRDQTLNETEVKEYCRKHLTGYKNPKHVEFIDTLPKSNVGKILRKELRPKSP